MHLSSVQKLAMSEDHGTMADGSGSTTEDPGAKPEDVAKTCTLEPDQRSRLRLKDPWRADKTRNLADEGKSMRG